jgi:hypothetical protein
MCLPASRIIPVTVKECPAKAFQRVGELRTGRPQGFQHGAPFLR